MSENAFMRRAAALALEKMRANSGGPFGAVIVRNDTIIAEGWNEVTLSNDPTAHAEIVAIRRACTLLGAFNLPDCDIYTSCEPCPMCLGAIYWARLRRVYYANTRADASQIGFDDGFIYSEVAGAGVEKDSSPPTDDRQCSDGVHGMGLQSRENSVLMSARCRAILSDIHLLGDPRTAGALQRSRVHLILSCRLPDAIPPQRGLLGRHIRSFHALRASRRSFPLTDLRPASIGLPKNGDDG